MIRSYLSLYYVRFYFFFFIMIFDSVQKKYCTTYIINYHAAMNLLSYQRYVAIKYITNWTRPFMSYVFSPKTYMYFYKHNMSILLQATKFTITYLPFYGPEEHIPGRNSVDQLIEQANISSQMFSFSKVSVNLQSSSSKKVNKV